MDLSTTRNACTSSPSVSVRAIYGGFCPFLIISGREELCSKALVCAAVAYALSWVGQEDLILKLK